MVFLSLYNFLHPQGILLKEFTGLLSTDWWINPFYAFKWHHAFLKICKCFWYVSLVYQSMLFCFLILWSHFWENLVLLRMNSVFINWYISVIAFVTIAPGSVLVSEYSFNVYFGIFVHCVENISILVFIYSLAVHFWSLFQRIFKIFNMIINCYQSGYIFFFRDTLTALAGRGSQEYILLCILSHSKFSHMGLSKALI